MYIFIFSPHTWSYDFVNCIFSEIKELLEGFFQITYRGNVSLGQGMWPML